MLVEFVIGAIALGGGLAVMGWVMTYLNNAVEEQRRVYVWEEELFAALEKRFDGASGLRVQWEVDEGLGLRLIHITGLLPSLELGGERGKWRGEGPDVEIDSPDFDDQVLIRGDKLAVYSRLDVEQRARARELVAAGLRIEFGKATLPSGATYGGTSAYFDADQLDNLVAFLAAFSAKQGAGQQERLFAIVRSDPELDVRIRVLRELLKQPEGLTSDLRELLIELIRAGSKGSGLMTEAEACAALEDPSGVRAIAAAHWLRFLGGESCRASLARAMNHPDAHPALSSIASKALASLERQFGAFSGGSLAIAEAQEGGALSVAAEGGQLEVVEEEAERKRRGAKEGQKG